MAKKAYSYIRFSSDKQKHGNSLQRQTERAQDFCRKNNLTLDESSYKDLGVSGFQGKNSSEGALKAFLDACDTGKIEVGSYLLVESLDRLSRNKIMKALTLFNSILEKGITVVTLMDNKTYGQDSLNDPMHLMYSLMIMSTAHEESAKKSDRIGKSWQNKRKLAREEHKPYTGKVSTWLTLHNGEYEIIEARANIIKEIFTMALQGNGKTAIARHLNNAGIENWNRGKFWHTSYIQKILSNKTVYGTLVTPKIGSIDNYFPAIVSRSDFLKVQVARKEKQLPMGKAINTISNIFTGLVVCGVCGSSMHYVNKSVRSKPETHNQKYLVCSKANTKGKCNYVSFRYAMIEKHIIYSLREMDYSKVFNKDMTDYSGKILLKKDQLSKIKSETANISLGLDFGLPDSALEPLRERLIQLDEQRTNIIKGLEELRSRQILSQSHNLSDLESVDKLLEDSTFDNRLKLHQILKSHISSISFQPIKAIGDVNALDEYQHSQLTIKFKNSDKERFISIYAKSQHLSSSFVQYGCVTDFDTDIIIGDVVKRYKTGATITHNGNGMDFFREVECG